MKLAKLAVSVGISLIVVSAMSLPAIAVGKGSTQTASHKDTTKCDGDPSGKSGTGNGANSTPSGPYTNTCPTSGQSANGNGGGTSTGRPCAGCVGQADDKNPPGQYPDSSDGNAGYECDRNHGIARGNPAHTGCTTTTTTVQPKRFGSSRIGDLECGSSLVDIFLHNGNNSAAGTRTFTIKVDGATVLVQTLAAGTVRTVSISIPDDGNSHVVTVASTGWPTSVKSLTVTHNCSTTQLIKQGSSSIGDLACNDSTVDITLHNGNEAAAGNRLFIISIDGISALQQTVAPGGTFETVSVAIPDDSRSHLVSVSSAGWPTVTKQLAVTHCGVLGTKFTRPNLKLAAIGIPTQVLGVKFTRSPVQAAVLGRKLARTGVEWDSMVVLGFTLLMIGMAFELKSRKLKVSAAL